MARILETRWYPHDLSLDEDIAVIGDVHGMTEPLGSLLDHLDDVRVIQLGDLIDRGPDSLGSVRTGWERIHLQGGILLPGNHEGLLFEALAHLDRPKVTGDGTSWHGFADPIDAWLSNGGGSMLKEIDLYGTLSPQDGLRAIRAALPSGYEAWLRSAPSHHRCGEILVVHAGVHHKAKDPEGWLAQPLTLDAANSSSPHHDHWAWIRGDWAAWAEGWTRYNARAVIHGHTAPWTRSFEDGSELSTHLDKLGTVGRINVDGGSYRNGTVAAVHLRKGEYRFLGAVRGL
ncbi:metallophosphoesterase [Jannaschia donghaensis]|uniref:Diadenosine tetraphosphatase n=1 Tax=Jannaschia donghaensis TaxID=420998 RepID=A0A0M6YN73_9RHOB|nr:metallophosphoesterase [Jannaschia donghaensis]CTQ51299.1 diadenosine tetraphosphatase [Jannaschia donghaensis]